METTYFDLFCALPFNRTLIHLLDKEKLKFNPSAFENDKRKRNFKIRGKRFFIIPDASMKVKGPTASGG